MNDDEMLRELRGTPMWGALLRAVDEGQLQGPIARKVGTTTQLIDTARKLDELGLVFVSKRIGGLHVTPNQEGKRVAGLIRRSETEGPDWFDAIERAVAAEVLYPSSEGSWRLTEVDGRPVSEPHLKAAIARLERWECVKGDDSWGGPARLDPGPYLAEVSGISGLLRDYFEGRGASSASHVHHDHRRYQVTNDKSRTTNTNNFSDSTVGIAAAGGEGNTLHAVQTITNDERSQVLEVLGELRSGMGDDVPSGVVEAVDALESAALDQAATKAGLKERTAIAIAAAATSSATSFVLARLADIMALVA